MADQHRQVSIYVSYSVAVLCALLRVVLRLRQYRTIYLDDYLVIFALSALAAAAAVTYNAHDLIFRHIHTVLGWEYMGSDFVQDLLDLQRSVQACSALVWTAIYAAKFSFIIFLSRLVKRIRPLEIYWWVVFGVLVVCAGLSIPLPYIVEPMRPQHDNIPAQVAGEIAYLDVTGALDIFTDSLLISIPVILLWNVQIQMKRKVALIGMFGLSVIMIVQAVIRTALAAFPNGVIDVAWMLFWQGIEATTAVIVISLTVFRSLFGRESNDEALRFVIPTLAGPPTRRNMERYDELCSAEAGGVTSQRTSVGEATSHEMNAGVIPGRPEPVHC